MLKDFDSQLKINIQASAPVVQIISHETLRIRACCIQAASDLNRDLYVWNMPQGLRKYDFDDNSREPEDEGEQPQEVLDWLRDFASEDEEPEFILLLEDFHHFLNEHTLISRLRAFAIAVASREINNVTVVLSQPAPLLPPELEKEVQVIEMPLPDTDDLKTLMRQACDRYNLDDRDYQESSALIESALGLSTSEAQLAFSKAACQFKRLTESEIPFIVKEKEQVIRKSGHLEYFHPKATLDDIGGLDNLKSWLDRRRQSFTEHAREFGLETPRGVLLLGLPGTGKSLAAKAVANAWQLPLLRLDMGKIYGGIVGQSEANIRSALQTAEALAPSILWVDEIEKGLSGMQSSGATDGGTTSRVLGTFLTWMQEKEKPVFVVATANHIAQLPPELLRKGRVDEIFFVDLPVQQDRKDIISIHLKRRNRLDDFSSAELDELAIASKGFTGAELEEAVKEAMFLAFDEGHQLNKDDILKAIKVTSPLSLTMAEMINDTRAWTKGRAVAASSAEPEALDPFSSKKPRLKQEGENPFVRK
ncbi:MAG: AAA family ATPase [Oceanospirillaceae bacterium]|nr:AAA family ATPase [Oceanospirillaceae bacterium]MAY00476.1 AAA family ATPase [Oceanospirillaceae bacterium]MBL34502.1 AAA family ATPase [Oceanospirillaceae bacterium]MBS52636.1 AAA family ATPase [Oceanospirillaceae bacterium]